MVADNPKVSAVSAGGPVHRVSQVGRDEVMALTTITVQTGVYWSDVGTLRLVAGTLTEELRAAFPDSDPLVWLALAPEPIRLRVNGIPAEERQRAIDLIRAVALAEQRADWVVQDE